MVANIVPAASNPGVNPAAAVGARDQRRDQLCAGGGGRPRHAASEGYNLDAVVQVDSNTGLPESCSKSSRIRRGRCSTEEDW